uniref:Transmembrane protein n=1 Tax=Rhinella marina erythrocytic-like virus TaxID=2859906 RepID=A0A8F6UA94_9VIRU|nr:hypothetical protein RMELV017 [Rhinella marina erythrocytic-like virus]
MKTQTHYLFAISLTVICIGLYILRNRQSRNSTEKVIPKNKSSEKIVIKPLKDEIIGNTVATETIQYPVVTTTFYECANECQNDNSTFDDHYHDRCKKCVNKCEAKYHKDAKGHLYGYCNCTNYSNYFYKGKAECKFHKGKPPKGGFREYEYLYF